MPRIDLAGVALGQLGLVDAARPGVAKHGGQFGRSRRPRRPTACRRLARAATRTAPAADNCAIGISTVSGVPTSRRAIDVPRLGQIGFAARASPRRSWDCCGPSCSRLPCGVSTGAALVRNATTRPSPKRLLDGQRRTVAQPGDDLRRRIGRRRPILLRGEVPLDHHRADEAVALAGKHRKDRMVGHFQVGRLVQAIDQQLGRRRPAAAETIPRRRDTDAC